VNSRQDGISRQKRVYAALGVNFEGAKFRASALNENCGRGTQDVLIACMDGLRGFSEAARAAFPETRIQKCIVPMGAQFHEVRFVQRFERGPRWSESDIPRSERGGRESGPGAIRRETAGQIPPDLPIMAVQPAGVLWVFQIS
jgi:hypothetical protein